MRKYSFIMAIPFVLAAVCHAAIIHIPGDASRIQAAYAMAETGDTLLVAPGTYQENVIFQGRGVVLASEYILSADSSLIDSTILTPLGSGSILEIYGPLNMDLLMIGLTFIHGSNVEEPGWGGAVFVDSASVGFRNCKFLENEAIRGGGIYGNYSQISVEESSFQSNFSDGYGGAVNVYRGVATIRNNKFFGNHTGNIGGALDISLSSGVIEQNVFNGNYTTLPVSSNGGGALMCRSNDSYGIPTSIQIVSNNFEDNYARSGGALNVIGIDSLQISDNLFRHNRGEDQSNLAQGGALYLGPECGYVEVIRNEFYYNYAQNKSGALQVMSSALIEDNLFFRNSTIYYGYATATQTGNGNVDMVAEFTDNLFFENYKTGNLYPLNHGCVQVDPTNTAVFHQNDFLGNVPFAAGLNPGWSGDLDVTDNYWGHESGPYHPTQNPEGLGDAVMEAVDILPFATEPFTTRWLHAPEPLELILPEADEFLNEDSVVFLWHVAPDSTPRDTIRYTLELSDSPSFVNLQLYYADEDTTVTVTGLNYESDYYWRVKATDIYDLSTYSEETRSFMIVSVDENEFTTIPTEWSIERMYPNPFNRMMHVIIAVPNPEPVRIAVYDLQGRLVETLHHGSITAGHHRFVWRPETATGMYFVRVSTNSWQEMRKVVYLK